jgi:plastocyanin
MKIRNILIIWGVAFLAMVTNTYAARYFVQFGGSFGLTYSPDSILVFVGDTIRWQGNFAMHPLSSTSVPPGAVSFHQASSDVFDYVVTVAGTYLYQCDFHFSSGMKGKIIALGTSGVNNTYTSMQPDAFRLRQNFPNPFNPSTTISFDIPSPTHVSIKVYNLIGEMIATIADENMSAGSYSMVWNAASIPSGVYFYRLNAGQFTQTRKLMVLK